jgi:hypothetical protein
MVHTVFYFGRASEMPVASHPGGSFVSFGKNLF